MQIKCRFREEGKRKKSYPESKRIPHNWKAGQNSFPLICDLNGKNLSNAIFFGRTWREKRFNSFFHWDLGSFSSLLSRICLRAKTLKLPRRLVGCSAILIPRSYVYAYVYDNEPDRYHQAAISLPKGEAAQARQDHHPNLNMSFKVLNGMFYSMPAR